MIILIFLMIVGLAAFFSIQDRKGKNEVMGWIPYWDQETAFQSFKKNVKEINYISVFWYRLDENGNVGLYSKAKENKSIIRYAKDNNVKVIALVANLSESNQNIWDYKRVDKAISDKEKRGNHIAQIVNLVEKNNFDGVDIDYESLKSQQKNDFSQFIKELSTELHKRNKILGVAVYPKTSKTNPYDANGAGAQDLKKIGKYADQLYFMTYLEHGSFSEPGPIGSLNSTNQAIKYGISQLPRSKIFIGIGLIGSRWVKENGQYKGADDELTFSQIVSISQNQKAEPIWDEDSKTPYINFWSNGNENIIWFENAESIKLRVELAKNLGVGGVSFWRLGNEDERIWRLF